MPLNNALASSGDTATLDEEFVAFKINPDIYSAFYLGYLLGKINTDIRYNYTSFSQEYINLQTTKNRDIVQYIEEMWGVDHLQNVEAMRHGYSATIQYRGLTFYCLPMDVALINRILTAANDVRTVFQLQTVFTTNGYVMVKISHDSYIVITDTMYNRYLTDTVEKP